MNARGLLSLTALAALGCSQPIRKFSHDAGGDERADMADAVAAEPGLEVVQPADAGIDAPDAALEAQPIEAAPDMVPEAQDTPDMDRASDGRDAEPPLPRFLVLGPAASDALAISADGQFIAGTVGNPGLAARWTAGGQLTQLGPFQSDQVSAALAISDDGLVAVGTSKTTVAGFGRAIVWKNSVPVDLGVLSGTTSCAAVATSRDGTVTAGGCNMGPVPGSQRRAFRVDASGMKDIGAIGGSTVCDAFAMAKDGAAIVGGCDLGGATHPFRWTVGGMSDLGLLPNAASCTARAIADTGAVVGNCDPKSFVWTPAHGMSELPVRPNKESSIPRAVSADGTVAVGYDYAGGGANFDAVIWRGQVETIASVLQSAGVDLTGWQLQTANAITADGKTVVGHGTNPSGVQQAWLARLP